MADREYNAEYYKRNKARLKAKQKLYYETVIKPDPARMEQCRDHVRRWKSANAEYNKLQKLEWAKNNPEKMKKAGEKSRNKIKRLKEKVKSYYGCMNPDCPCASKLPAYCLDFHHLEDKQFHIGNACTRRVDDIMKEMVKCTILCAICHRMETWGELDASVFPKCSEIALIED